jgi:hypothetical protein
MRRKLVRRSHRSLQGHRLHDGRLRSAFHVRRHRRVMVSRVGLQRPALEFRSVRKVLTFLLCEELQDALPGYFRRARLSRPVHTVPSAFYFTAKGACSLEAHHLFQRGALAQLVRNGALLHSAPRLVPPVSRRGRASLEYRSIPQQRSIRSRNRPALQIAGALHTGRVRSKFSVGQELKEEILVEGVAL